MYKLLTAIVTEMLYNHAIAIGAIPQEQQALIRKKRGCTDALLIDGMITQLAKKQRTPLSVAWVDYQKAFDRVPHQWIDALLRSIKAPKIIKKCLRRIIPMWATTFSVGKGEKEVQFELQLKRGIFQGDSLSPLLFCLAISPISHVLQQPRASNVVVYLGR